MGVPAHNTGHNGRICYAQTGDAVYPQVGIYHGQRVAAHFTGADGVVERFTVFAQEFGNTPVIV
jgi:hypothetical protein